MMDPLWSETYWSTFKYVIILIVSTYYILCISWIIKCLIPITGSHVHCYMRQVINYQRTAVPHTKKQHFSFYSQTKQFVYNFLFLQKCSQFCSIIQCIRQTRVTWPCLVQTIQMSECSNNDQEGQNIKPNFKVWGCHSWWHPNLDNPCSSVDKYLLFLRNVGTCLPGSRAERNLQTFSDHTNLSHLCTVI